MCLLDPCTSRFANAGSAGIQTPLMDIVNLSFETGVFPEGLKEVPLLKKSTLDPKDPANYQPVSSLPFLGKII